MIPLNFRGIIHPFLQSLNEAMNDSSNGWVDDSSQAGQPFMEQSITLSMDGMYSWEIHEDLRI